MAHPSEIAPLVATLPRGAPTRSRRSQRAWRDWLPKRATSARRTAGSRASCSGTPTCCARASVYEEECGAHTITQGGYYQYALGHNLGYRSWLHYLLPIVYTEPELAREILRYSIQLQPEPTATSPLRHRAAVHALRPRHVQRPRLLAAARRRPSTGSGRATRSSSTSRCTYYDTEQQATRVGAHQARLPPPGVDARAARRLHHGRDRRLVGLLDAARADDRVERSSRRSSPTPTRSWPSWPSCAATTRSPRSCARAPSELRAGRRRRVDRQGLVLARLARRPADRQGRALRRAAAVGAARRRPDAASRPRTLVAQHPPLPRPASARPAARRRSARRWRPRATTRTSPSAARAIDPTDGKLPDVLGLLLEQVPNAPLAGRRGLPGRRLVRHQRPPDVGARRARRRRARRARPGLGRVHAQHARHATPTRSPTTGTARSRSTTRAAPGTRADPARCGIGVAVLDRPDHRAADLDGDERAPPRRRHADARRLPHRPAPAAWSASTSALPRASASPRDAALLRGYVTPERSGPIELRVRLPDRGTVQAYANGEPVAQTHEDGYAVFTAQASADEPLDWALARSGRGGRGKTDAG